MFRALLCRHIRGNGAPFHWFFCLQVPRDELDIVGDQTMVKGLESTSSQWQHLATASKGNDKLR